MPDLTQHEMAQFDAQEFAVIQECGKMEHQVEGFLLTIHRAYDRKRGYGSSKWMLTNAEVEAILAKKAAAGDEHDTSLRARPSQIIEGLARVRAVIAGLNAQIDHLEGIYADRWQRYFPCLNADGHIHRSLRGCKTVGWTTDMGWATGYSGLTVEQAIHGVEGQFEGLGETLCSVCFPQAPVEWCKSRREVTRAQRDAEREAKRLERERLAAEKEARIAARAALAAERKAARGMTPQDRRSAAMRALGEKWSESINTPGFGTEADRELIAADIEQLLELGRSENWQRVVTAWAEQVRENEYLWHAFVQWNNYAANVV